MLPHRGVATLGLQFIDNLHRPHFRRAGDRAAGKGGAQQVAGVQRHWQAGGDGADQMMDRRERLHHEQLGDPDAARDGDAADVVAHQVDNH